MTIRETSVAARKPSWRIVWLLPAGSALLLGLNAGLLLLGVPAPLDASRLPEVHGMLLTLGFVATLVSLERATALDRWYGYLAPALLGAGGIALVAPAVPLIVGKCLLVAGMAAFTLVYVPLWRRQYDGATLTQLLAAALGLVGAILWLGLDSVERIVPWLTGFLILTIAAERVELARITMGPNAPTHMLAFGWAMTAALVTFMISPEVGAIILGIVILALVAWLVRHDIARRTINATGVTRYMAASILFGYLWLTVAGAILLFGVPDTQPSYDAFAHAIFLGYTFSMIMAHATTILPAVLRIQLPWRPASWAPVLLLQVALIVRLWLGDGLGNPLALQLGGVLGVAALLLFMITAVTSAIMGPPKTDVTTSSDATKEATAS